MSSLVAQLRLAGRGERRGLQRARREDPRQEQAAARPARSICFSPHPDDDVISMGGILRKLVRERQRDHRRLHDERQHRRLRPRRAALRRLPRSASPRERLIGDRDGRRARANACTPSSTRKKPGDVDIPEVQDIKRIIREAEAVAGIETLGLTRAARALPQPAVLPDGQGAQGSDRPGRRGDRARAARGGPARASSSSPATCPIRTARTACARRRSTRALRASCAGSSRARKCGCTAAPGRSGRSPRPPGSCRCRRRSCGSRSRRSSSTSRRRTRRPSPGSDDREFWQRVEARNKDTAATARPARAGRVLRHGSVRRRVTARRRMTASFTHARPRRPRRVPRRHDRARHVVGRKQRTRRTTSSPTARSRGGRSCSRSSPARRAR